MEEQYQKDPLRLIVDILKDRISEEIDGCVDDLDALRYKLENITTDDEYIDDELRLVVKTLQSVPERLDSMVLVGEWKE